jgi:hypothetical protein
MAMDEFAGHVRRTLVKAVPFDGACLSTFDPATLLPTGCAVENALPPVATLRLYELEARRPDFNAFSAAISTAAAASASSVDHAAGADSSSLHADRDPLRGVARRPLADRVRRTTCCAGRVTFDHYAPKLVPERL